MRPGAAGGIRFLFATPSSSRPAAAVSIAAQRGLVEARWCTARLVAAFRTFFLCIVFFAAMALDAETRVECLAR